MRIPLPKIAKRAVKRALLFPGVHGLAARYAGIHTCLNYHRITLDSFRSDSFNPNIWLSVHRDAFESQIRFISENFLCLPLGEATQLLSDGRLPSNSITVTFDDGYRDNLTVGLPILEKYAVPATIFVTTGFIERSANLWWEEHSFVLQKLNSLVFDWNGKNYSWKLSTLQEKNLAATKLRTLFKQLGLEEQSKLLEILRAQSAERFCYENQMITWDELATLDRHPLITIGSHTKSHPVLSHLADADLEVELRGSKMLLEERLHHPINLFAYPIGQKEHASAREFAAAKSAGFSAGLTSRAGHFQVEHREFLHALPRIAIDYYDTIASLRWKLSGFEAMLLQRGQVFVTD